MKNLIFILCFICYSTFSLSQNQLELCLEDFLSIALTNSKQAHMIDIQSKINVNTYKTKQQLLRPTVSFNFNPSYNQSITAITQPDGSLINHNISNFSISPNLSVKIPISFTGGTLSLSSSIDFYRNFNPNNNYTNLNANFYHIGISQPLSFFNKDKLSKKETKTRFKLDKLSEISDYLKLKKSFTIQFLKFYKVFTNLSLLKNRETFIDENVEIAKKLAFADKTLESKLFELQISRTHIGHDIDKLKRHLSNISEEINNIIGDSTKHLSIIPIIQFNNNIRIDSCELINRIKYIDSIYTSLNKVSFENNILEAKNNKRIWPTISFGIGNNSSSSEFRLLWKNMKPSYNLSINFSIPISDIPSNKIYYQNALLNFEKHNLKQEIETEAKVTKINQFFNNLISAENTLEDTKNTSSLYLKILNEKKSLLNAARISFLDYENSLNRFNMNQLEFIDGISSIYETLSDIELITFYDYIHNIDYLKFLEFHQP